MVGEDRHRLIVFIVLDELVSTDVDFILIEVRKTSPLASLDKARESILGGKKPSRFSLGR